MKSLLFIFLLLTLSLSHNLSSQTVTLQGSERSDYFVDILKNALSYSSNKNYQLSFYNKWLPKSRVFNNIATNGGIDIIAAGATIEREKLLQPIRLPLLKGLFGWRIPLVNKNNSHLFLPQLSTQAFKKLTVGQLHSWSDTKVLESNHIHVEKGSHYKGLFQMLAANRFDYFPRSILEVHGELDANKSLNITIDTNILLHYPTAYFFYVSKSNTTLAEDVTYGLEQSLKDGSFERLFNRYYGEIVSQTINEKRRIYHLKNPFLPKKTPLQRKELWLDLSTNEDIIL